MRIDGEAIAKALKPIVAELDTANKFADEAVALLKPYSILAFEPVLPLSFLHPLDQGAAIIATRAAVDHLTTATTLLGETFGSNWMRTTVDNHRAWAAHASSLLDRPASEIAASEVIDAMHQNRFGADEVHGLLQRLSASSSRSHTDPEDFYAASKVFNESAAMKVADDTGMGSWLVQKYQPEAPAVAPLGMQAVEAARLRVR